MNFTIAKASFASLPLIKSATILTFLAEILAFLRVATASESFLAFLPLYLPPYFLRTISYFLVVLSPA